jgi:hypothetical protein
MEHAGIPFQVLSQKDTSQNGVPEPFFPGISVTNALPL